MTAFVPPGGPGGLYDWLPGGNTLWNRFLEDNPQAAYQRWLNSQGLGGATSPRGQFYRNQYQQQYQSYLGGAPDRPLDYSWVQFLQDNGSNLENLYRSQAPRDRGENPGLYQQRYRWVNL